MHWKLLIAALLALVPLPFSDALHSDRQDNIVMYWGQNSKNQETSQKRLREYCDDNSDIFLLSFLHVFHSTGGFPEVNFANGCNDGTLFAGTNLLQCPSIAEDIKYCQSRGKTILLSLGGAAGLYGFRNDQQAEEFADQMWNMFGNGTSPTLRPFGDVVLDGFDLDIEGGAATGYVAFTNQMRRHYDNNKQVNSCKKFYMAMAPQCPIPDYFLNTALLNAHFDLVLVQFYNNYCEVTNFRPGSLQSSNFNFKDWDSLIKTQAYNKDAKVFLGVPGSPTAAGTGYAPASLVIDAARELRKYSSFGGVMVWDASQGYSNMMASGESFVEHIKRGIAQSDGTGPSDDQVECSVEPSYPPFTSTATVSSIISTASVIQTSNQVPTPSSSPSCPVIGAECQKEGEKMCMGNSYAVCRNGAWLERLCPNSKVCQIDSDGYVYCDYQSGEGDGAECSGNGAVTTSSISAVTTASTTAPTGPTQTPTPCPVIGESCPKDGVKQCMGKKYAYCRVGKWVERTCGGNTVCGLDHEGFVTCEASNSEGLQCGIVSSSTALETKTQKTRSETSVTVTSSIAQPSATVDCPDAVAGQPCENLGQMICIGQFYLQCAYTWVTRPCPAGSVCRTQTSSLIVCDREDSSGGKQGDNYQCMAQAHVFDSIAVETNSTDFQNRKSVKFKRGEKTRFSSSTCPDIGGSCESEGEKKCIGKNYAMCRGGTWAERTCFGAKVCTDDKGFVFCDYNDGPGDGFECSSGEQPSSTTAATTTPTPAPEPSGCPSIGDSCNTEGTKKCMGKNYAYCRNGVWTKRSCGSNKVCVTEDDGFVFCDYADGNGDGAQCDTPPVSTTIQSTFTGTPTATTSGSRTSNSSPTGSCASISPGAECHNYNTMTCYGKNYLQCNGENQLFRPCPAGTVCRTTSSSTIVCDWLDSSGGTAGDNAECVISAFERPAPSKLTGVGVATTNAIRSRQNNTGERDNGDIHSEKVITKMKAYNTTQ